MNFLTSINQELTQRRMVMENNFESYSLDELIAILCEQDLKISELKEIFSAFYFNYCKSKGQNPAKLRYVRIVNTSHYGETYGSYCKNTIDINTAYLVKLFSKNSSINRLKIISTLIHENRHFVQDEIKPCSTEQKLAYLCSKLFGIFCRANWIVFNQYQEKIKTGTPLEKTINTALAQEHMSQFFDYKETSYGMLPHEIDARNHTKDELQKFEKTTPEFGEVIKINSKDSKFLQEICCFSLFENFDRAHKFFDAHKNELDPNVLQQYYDYEKQALDLYNKYSVTTPQEEKAFIKNLYPLEFNNTKSFFK